MNKLRINIDGCQSNEHFDYIAKTIADALKTTCIFDTGVTQPDECEENYCLNGDCQKQYLSIESDELNIIYEMED